MTMNMSKLAWPLYLGSCPSDFRWHACVLPDDIYRCHPLLLRQQTTSRPRNYATSSRKKVALQCVNSTGRQTDIYVQHLIRTKTSVLMLIQDKNFHWRKQFGIPRYDVSTRPPRTPIQTHFSRNEFLFGGRLGFWDGSFRRIKNLCIILVLPTCSAVYVIRLCNTHTMSQSHLKH